MGLRVEHVDKSFAEVHVITDLSMEVREGSLFGFLGPNGAGKTTTMRMILDILRPDSGHITWNGQDVSNVPRCYWGYLPEERGLYPKVEVEEQLLFLARLHGLSKFAARTHLDEWLERFQITEYRNKKVEELSKGNQQKIQFLATILHDPLILIMDEPFSGLDPINATILKEAFEEMHRRGAEPGCYGHFRHAPAAAPGLLSAGLLALRYPVRRRGCAGQTTRRGAERGSARHMVFHDWLPGELHRHLQPRRCVGQSDFLHPLLDPDYYAHAHWHRRRSLVGDCAHHRVDARGHLPLRGHLCTHLSLRSPDVRAKAGTEATVQGGTGGIGIDR